MDTELNQFYQHLTAERGLAPLTVAAYAGDLQDFWEFVESRGLAQWGAVSLAHLQEYLAALEGRGLSARSRARKLSALRQFYRFLQREEKVCPRPTRWNCWTPPVCPGGCPRCWGKGRWSTLLAGPDPATPKGQRDAALLELLYATGLRVSELVGLTLKQLDLRRGVVRPLGKGSKERVVPMVAKAVEKLELYLAQGRPRLLKGRQSQYLFVNRRGGHLTRQGFWKILKDYARKQGLAA